MDSRFINSLRPLLVSAIAFAVTGCTVGPNYQQPKSVTLDEWGELASASSGSSSRPATRPSSAPPIVQWWTVFGDSHLNSLVERAVRGNIDLRRAQARVREARAQHDVVGADEYPRVDINGSYSHSRTPAGAFGGVAGNASSIGTGANVGGFPGEFDFYRLGFDASWEIDVFGGVRRNVEAARADVAAASEDRRDVMVTLLGDVARYYINLRGFQRQLSIAKKNLASQRETLELTNTLLRIGRGTELDVSRAQAQVSTTEAQIPSLETEVRQSMHQLSVLLGMNPMALLEELSDDKAIPVPPEETAVGVPAQLLRRRPDIRRAERQLAAATARVGAATADLYPRFSLTGSFGTEDTKAKNLFNYASRFYSIGPAISWPIFDAGRIRATIRVRSAQQEQALATYESVVLNAQRDVEDALVAYAKEETRRRTLVQSVESNRRAVELAKQLNEAGRVPFLDVLQAQRDLLTAEESLVLSERNVATDLVALYKALGGGWEVLEEQRKDEPQPQQTPPQSR
jgi:NodT family efflux transporter outer membrane factor (OMF) lipoprotein